MEFDYQEMMCDVCRRAHLAAITRHNEGLLQRERDADERDQLLEAGETVPERRWF